LVVQVLGEPDHHVIGRGFDEPPAHNPVSLRTPTGAGSNSLNDRRPIAPQTRHPKAVSSQPAGPAWFPIRRAGLLRAVRHGRDDLASESAVRAAGRLAKLHVWVRKTTVPDGGVRQKERGTIGNVLLSLSLPDPAIGVKRSPGSSR
jgi:hypothetical protein